MIRFIKLKLLCVFVFTAGSAQVYAGQYTALDFFASTPYDYLPLHEMLDLTREAHAEVIEAMREGLTSYSLDYDEEDGHLLYGKVSSYSFADDSLKIKLLFGGAFHVELLDKSGGGYLGVMQTYFGKIQDITFFDISADHEIAPRSYSDLGFTDVRENELLLPDEQFPEDENGRLIFGSGSKGVFQVYINGWYVPKWENKKAAYAITFEWDGRVFQKHVRRY